MTKRFPNYESDLRNFALRVKNWEDFHNIFWSIHLNQDLFI